MKTGIAHLPLHYGRAPHWLFQKMKLLAREISLAVLHEYGRQEFLNRISDPYWFQGLGCILGFDWHSSGLTTTVCGALKEGLKGLQTETGIFIAGGKGNTSRKTPLEIENYLQKFSVNTSAQDLVYASRMSAKVDSAAVQDGYQLYHHCFFFIKEGQWAVVQQGMNEESRWARRYHWLGEDVRDFVCEPHKAVCSHEKKQILNMVAAGSSDSRHCSVTLCREKPLKLITEIKNIQRLDMPKRHGIRAEDFKTKNLEKVLISTYEQKPPDYETLLGTKGVGPKTVRALALLSEFIYNVKPSQTDPVRYSFAHGGKDGIPFPVDRKQYDHSIDTLRTALKDAKIGYSDKLRAFKKLARFEKSG